MSMPYRIHASDMSSAVVQLVQQFKKENPGLDGFEATFVDGTKVKISIKKIKQKAEKSAKGDGQ